MKLTTALALVLAVTTPAWANDITQTGPGSQAGVTGGGTGAAAASTSTATARQSQSQTARGTGVGIGQGGAGGAGGRGGMGGSATANVSINGLGGGSGGGSYGGGSRAPDVFLPTIGGGGMDCPTVGFGAAGSGLAGGGGIGPSWISSDCNKRKVADLLAHLFGPAVARAYAEQNIDGVSAAVAATTVAQPVQHPAWCVDSRGRWLADLAECGPADPR